MQGILNVFQPAWNEQKVLPGGTLVVYSNRGNERFSEWKTYRFEASSASGFFSDVGSTNEDAYTEGTLPAAGMRRPWKVCHSALSVSAAAHAEYDERARSES